jgi:peptidoglycan/xylan/chitin deacetylase (PgdA/CDA1 family)
MKSFLKNSLLGLYKYTGVLRVQEVFSQWTGRCRAVILLFHRVTDEIPEDALTVSTGRFRRMCRLLRRSFRVVSLGDMYGLLGGGKALPRRAVVITFDDCYRDNLFAAQILAEHGLPACFFLPTGMVGTEHTFPWDLNPRRLPNLSWDDVRTMARLGFDFGSHTVTHANLAALSPEQARRELVESRATIEDQVGRHVRWFAYPFGGRQHFRREQLDLVEEAGYDSCLSAHGGFIHRRTDRRLLPREDVNFFRSMLHLELHLAGCLNWLHSCKRRLGLQADVPDHLYGLVARSVDRRIPPAEAARIAGLAGEAEVPNHLPCERVIGSANEKT